MLRQELWHGMRSWLLMCIASMYLELYLVTVNDGYFDRDTAYQYAAIGSGTASAYTWDLIRMMVPGT